MICGEFGLCLSASLCVHTRTPHCRLRVLYKKIFARQRRPRRTADLSQFPATALEMYGHGSGSAAGTSHSGTGAGANGVNDSSANEEGAARRSHSGDIEAEDDKASKYEEDDEYDEEEDVSDEDDDGSSTEGEDQGNAEEDEDNEAIDIQLFEGELVVSTKESAEEQIAVCVKVSEQICHWAVYSLCVLDSCHRAQQWWWCSQHRIACKQDQFIFLLWVRYFVFLHYTSGVMMFYVSVLFAQHHCSTCVSV